MAAVLVNDVYRPYVRPRATDRELLRVARISSVAVTALGVALVPLFMMFDSIYEALGAVAGDLLHISDRRRWLGGLRSSHGMVEEIVDGDDAPVELGPRVFEDVVGRGRGEELVRVERLY